MYTYNITYIYIYVHPGPYREPSICMGFPRGAPLGAHEGAEASERPPEALKGSLPFVWAPLWGGPSGNPRGSSGGPTEVLKGSLLYGWASLGGPSGNPRGLYMGAPVPLPALLRNFYRGKGGASCCVCRGADEERNHQGLYYVVEIIFNFINEIMNGGMDIRRITVIIKLNKIYIIMKKYKEMRRSYNICL